jgi:hypothetical protein
VGKTAGHDAGLAERDPGEEEDGGGTRGAAGDNVARGPGRVHGTADAMAWVFQKVDSASTKPLCRPARVVRVLPLQST